MNRVGQEHLGAHRASTGNVGMLCNVLMLGEDNPQSADPRHALFPYPPGCAGHRLMEILGLTTEEHLGLWRTNLCCPSWSKKQARERAAVMTGQDVPWRTIVCLGRKVSDVMAEHTGLSLPAWSTAFAPYTRPLVVQGGATITRTFTVVSLPHPSGRNMIWNDRLRWSDARMLMRSVDPGGPWAAPGEVRS